MASSFLQQKAKKQAEKLEKEYGPSAYGGTTWLNEQASGKKKKKDEDEDIAPVKKTTATTTTKKDEEDRKWFDSGLFEDGWDKGDLWKTILGTATDVAENIGAGIVGMGEKALDAIAYVSPLLAKGQYYQNGGAYHDAQTQKMFEQSFADSKKWSEDFIKKDWYDEEEIAKKIVLGTDKNSVLGEKSDALIQSGGQLLGTIGLQAAGVPWFLTTGATSFGSQAEVALNDGAGYEEAGLSSAISAGAEILTEKLSGGIKFGGKTLDDVLLKPLTEKIASKTVKKLGNLVVDAVGEGAEEVVSGVFSNLGTSIYKKKDIKDLLFSEEAMDEYLESFIGGAVLGGVGSSIHAIQDNKRIHLTENEQKVVDYEYEKRTEGKTLTAKEESKVRNDVVLDMLRGRISTDTIEEVLGGETYQTWKDTVDSEDALQREYDELGKKQNATLAEQTRYNELHQQLKDLKTTSQRNSLKEQLGNEVMSLVQSERLAESYNERSRRGQAFEADISKYDAKQQATIQKAIDSGILNNTNGTHDFVDLIAKISADKGVPFDFTNNEKLKESGFAVDGKAVNGFLNGDTITLNMDSAKARNSVVGHEITHVLEGTELYQTLQNTVIEYAKAKGDYQGRYDALTKLYEGVEGADINAELTADLVGDYLFSDTDFVRNLSVQHRNVFQKIYDEIKYLCKVATAGSKEARELEKVKKVFEEAYRAKGKATDTKSEDFYDASTKYSLRVTDKDTLDFLDNQETVTTYKTMQLVDGKLYPPMASRIEGKFEDYSELGAWEQATEHPELIKNGNKFKLDKGKGQGSIEAAYNPYMHSSNLVLNDQFSGAYKRDNLVTVECEVPVSELTSGYHAEFAKDSVGWHPWHTGTVAGQLRNAKGTERQVLLSRWIKPVRIVPDAEVAAKYKELLDGTDVEVPDNVVTPALLKELKNAGVKIKESGRLKYSLSETTDGRFVAVVDNDILSTIDTSSWDDTKKAAAKKAAVDALKQFGNGIVVDGITRKVNRTSRREYTRSNYTESLYNKAPDVFADKMRAADIADDIVVAATDWSRDGGLKHPRTDDFVDFDHGNTLIVSGDAKYSAEVVVGITKNGEAVFYDVVDLKPAEFEVKKEEVPTTATTQNAIGDIQGTSFADNVTQGQENVKYSLSDSDGKQLSKEQQEYFKDSKVRDGNGNLKVMYHGTPNGDFTVFKDGTYFTDNKEYADRYQNPSASSISSGKTATNPKTFEVYLDIKKPFDISDPEAREIYINEYIKGGNALGINPYLSDAEYRKIKTIDWTEGEDLRDFLIDNEYDYDGLVLDEGADGGYGDDVSYRGKSYVVFSPEQIKNVDNQVPTSDPDIRKSLSNVGEDAANSDSLSALKLETAPVEAPVQETVAENATVEENLFPDDDYAPIADDPERFDSLDDADVPPERVVETGERSNPVKMPKNTVNMIAENVRDSLWVENKQMGDVRRIVEEYAMQEFPDKDWLFQELKDNFGSHTEKSVDEETKEVKNALRRYRLNVSDVIKSEIADYNDLRRRNFGKVLFSRQGTAVDVAYEELSDMYPGFFPNDIINPTDQLLQIINVANMDATNEYTHTMNDETVWDVVNDIAETVSDYQHIRSERDAGRPMPKEAFDDLVKNADKYAPARPPQQAAFDAPIRANATAPTYDAQAGKGVVDGQQSFVKEEPKQQTEEERKQTRKQLHQSIVDNVKATFKAKGFDFDKVLKNAENLSTFSTVDNMPQRVMEKALGYKEGQTLSDLTVNKVAQNETEGIKWLNKQVETIKNISKQHGIKPGSKASAAAQMYAEGFYVAENNDIIAYGDAELAKDFPDIRTQQNIKRLANDPRIRQIYDDTLAMINASRTRNAYPEIPRLDNYFLHFRAMDDTFSKLGLPFNPNDIRAKDLPTDLNGVTADLKPGQPYFASAMHRTGKRTSFDLLGGLERYLNSAKNQIYHIDDIQTLRALRNYIADTYGQANGLEGLDVLSEEEAQERIEKVYNSHLSTFAKFLNEEANVLAGKTALIDRGLEGIIGRRGITFLDTVNKQVGSNMVGFNLSSSLTNFLPVAQTFAKTNKFDFVKAFSQTVANKLSFGHFDSFTKDSPVIIRRKGSDRFYRTPWQKAGDVGYVFMSAVDDFSTELIARTKYNELTRKGMDTQKAHYETDKWVSRLMGDRSIGQMPQLYNSKMLGLVTKFQLEVRNQLDSQFYDTIQDAKVSAEHIENRLARNAKMAAKVTSTLTQLALVQHLFGKAFESVAGYNPAFDIIEVLMTAFGYDDDEDSEDTVLDNVEQAFLELLEDLPYTSTFTDGGRIPISSALPIGELIKGVDEWGNEKSRWKTLGEIAPYYLMPGGYGQAKKTKAGLEMFSDDHPIAGSYTDSGNLRFPVEDTLKNRVQAGIFGQWSSENARDYFDNERKPLAEKKIQEFKALDISIQDYWAYQDEAKKISDRAESEGASDKDILKSKYLNSVNDELAELIKEKQKIMDDPSLSSNTKQLRIKPIQQRFDELAKEGYASYNNVKIDGDYANIGDRYFQWYTPEEGEPYWRKLTEAQTTKYLVTSKAGPNANYATDGNVHYRRDEDGEWTKISDKQLERQNEVTKELGITPEEYWSETEISFMPMSNGEYEYAFDNPENYAVAKAVGGYDAFRGYSKDLYDIKADKDENGKSISGSRKEKVLDYINNLDADYYTKIILWKSEYPSDDSNNTEIIEYLNGRDDISFDETVAILRKLGFDVTDDGDISW